MGIARNQCSALPDILVTSVGRSGPVLTREMLERAIAARAADRCSWSISAFRAT